ncbi:hypothetical protein [Rubripirellula reticaptiva]|nr:hypothetical protein [Rubripirellula reticaptiva]
MTCLSLFCFALTMAGCGEPANKTVTGNADMDAIKAYEASMAALSNSQSSMEKPGGEDKEAVDPIKPNTGKDAK